MQRPKARRGAWALRCRRWWCARSATAARLARIQGPSAIAEFAARLDPRQLAAVRAFRSPTTGRLTPPSRASLHRILSGIDPDALVTITEREVEVRFRRRAHLPIIVASGLLDEPVTVPWWNGTSLRMRV